MNEKQEPDEMPGEKEYPPLKVVLPAMAAIWLAFFLVALVSLDFIVNVLNMVDLV